MESDPLYVGIDVLRAQLDLAERPSDDWMVSPQPRRGPHHPCGAAARSTSGLRGGGYGEVCRCHLARALTVAGIPVAVVNLRQVRDFVKATGQLAKTDAVDAQILARFAEAVRPPPCPLPDEATQQFGVLLTPRRQRIEMLVAEQPRMRMAPHPIQRQIQAHLTQTSRATRHRGLVLPVGSGPSS
jgi:transposase